MRTFASILLCALFVAVCGGSTAQETAATATAKPFSAAPEDETAALPAAAGTDSAA